MNHSNSTPYFPDNLQDYAPWVAIHGLTAPYGECQCGCGQRTRIVKKTDREWGYLKNHPTRYVVNHNHRRTYDDLGPNPSGYCMCGCGQRTNIAEKSHTETGDVKGTPYRYLPGHHNKNRSTPADGRFWSNVNKNGPIHPVLGTACWVWAASCQGGYGQFWDGTQITRAHRYAYTLAYGSISDEMLVCHHCDNPPCCRPDHLFAGTYSDNSRDMFAKGRNRNRPLPGEQNPHALFTNDQARAFRKEFATSHCTIEEFSRIHDVNPATMRSILRRKSYRNA